MNRRITLQITSRSRKFSRSAGVLARGAYRTPLAGRASDFSQALSLRDLLRARTPALQGVRGQPEA